MLFSIPFDCSYYDTIIFMYCGLGDTKLPRRPTHRRFVFYDVKGKLNCPFLQISFHCRQHS